MTKTFTQNDVIRFIYGEIVSACENQEMIEAINSNNELADFYFEMAPLRRSLNKIKKEPSQSTLDRILQFSKNHPMNALAR